MFYYNNFQKLDLNINTESEACEILTTNPNFCMILAYFRAASRESSSLLAPVHTILPELKISAVVRGSLGYEECVC